VQKPIARHSALQTRRNLLAAGSVLVTALWARAANANHGHHTNHGHHYGNGGPSGNAGSAGAHCFLRGTLIRTPTGEQEINTLAIGDLVVTYSGNAKPIKWIGRRSLHRDTGERWSADIAPIKVAPSALADGVPHRDLYLSPRHAVYVDGLLVTVGSLVNGINIVCCDTSDLQRIDYFHIELAQYDIVFAEGAPSETLTSLSGEHLFFDNWSERSALQIDESPMAQGLSAIDVTGGRRQLRSRLRSAFAPVVDRRTDFDRLRDRLEDRAQWMKSAA
jgi:hypothetical protein